MKRLLIGIASAVTAFFAVRKAMKTEGTFEWIDADDTDELETMYSTGEKVMLWNPYIDDYVDFDPDHGPLVHIVESSKWDADDECFRYKLENEEDWYAESWLVELEYPTMVDWNENKNTETGEESKMNNGSNGKQGQPKGHRAAEKAEVARRKAWAKRADELLDLYNGHRKKGNVETAEEIMAQYKYEQAMFNAGTAIREAGGDLGGEREESE